MFDSHFNVHTSCNNNFPRTCIHFTVLCQFNNRFVYYVKSYTYTQFYVSSVKTLDGAFEQSANYHQ